MKNHFIDQKIDLGFFPTPLQKLNNLSKLYNDYQIYIKRDDQTGLASGGNKTRKLEYLLQEAIDNKCDTVITAGAQQSNHCRQTASACASLGLECHLLLGGEAPQNYEGNLLLSYLLGANLHFTGKNRKGEDIAKLKATLEIENKKCYIIPYGGSNFIGALGFVNAIGELQKQLKEQQLNFDYIFFASSSGGMQAGLTLGIEYFKLDTLLMPISIDKEEINNLSLDENVLKLVNEGVNKLNLSKSYQLKDVQLIKGYDNDGYGVITEKEIYAIKKLAQNEGIILDPVYTGRAFYAMLDHLDKKQLKPNTKVLFWHSGGFPSNFYYSNELKK